MGATIYSNLALTVSQPGRGQPSLDERATIKAILDAGARARAVADALASVGLAAVLMDAAGRVLHVDPAAEALFGDSLRLQSSHLVGCDDRANRAIETALNGVLSGEARRDVEAEVVRVRADGSLVITAVPFADASSVQLLRVILLIDADAARLAARLATLDL